MRCPDIGGDPAELRIRLTSVASGIDVVFFHVIRTLFRV